jgi:hypothetical protein
VCVCMHMMDDLQLRHTFTAKDPIPIYISYSLGFVLSMQLILIQYVLKV